MPTGGSSESGKRGEPQRNEHDDRDRRVGEAARERPAGEARERGMVAGLDRVREHRAREHGDGGQREESGSRRQDQECREIAAGGREPRVSAAETPAGEDGRDRVANRRPEGKRQRGP